MSLENLIKEDVIEIDEDLTCNIIDYDIPYEWCTVFQHVVDYFDEMFDGDEIKHFYIWYATWWMHSYYENVAEECRDIQKELVIWIRKEKEEGRLTKSPLWMPDNDGDSSTYDLLSYKKMFLYQNYYFKLIIEPICGECTHCQRGDNPIHFILALYGWKDKMSDYIQPYNKNTIGTDMILSTIFRCISYE